MMPESREMSLISEKSNKKDSDGQQEGDGSK